MFTVRELPWNSCAGRMSRRRTSGRLLIVHRTGRGNLLVQRQRQPLLKDQWLAKASSQRALSPLFIRIIMTPLTRKRPDACQRVFAINLTSL